MKTIKQLMSAAALSILASTASLQVAATESTTGNVVYTTTNPAPSGTNIGQSWTGISNVTSTGGNTTSDNGSFTGYNPSTGTFMFGYNQGTIYYTYAINQALANAGAGIQVRGYNWSWEINNLNYDDRQSSVDTLNARITTFAANNSTILHQQYWTYNTKFDWTTFSGTVNFDNPLSPAEYGNMQLMMTGRDSGFWAGYYGPMVRNIDIRLRYGVDPCVTNPQSSPTCNGYRTYYTGVMTDDGYAQINLPFAFPFYGQTFTTSYMFTNGVIGFLNPNNVGGYCCDGTNLHDQRFVPGSPWNFAIYALNTDLDVGPNSQFYTETTQQGSGLRYHWDRVNELGTNNENTFSVELRNTGYIGINYTQVNLDPGRNPLIGIAGDISQNQYSQYYFGPAYNLPNLSGITLNYSGTETTDICASNPLYNPSCPGYQQAYFNQQCSINALYDPTCPGYAAAYLTYQCNLNQLYSASCPGYQQAYLDQQCGISPLYSNSCVNYQTALNQCTADPLTASYCPGFQTAITECSTNGLLHTYCPTYQSELNYCSTDPLFNNLCPTYQTASSQCSANPLTASYCPLYQTATNQCSVNPLTAAYCPNYQTATTECTVNPLYGSYCPSYQTATASCAANSLNHSYCPGYTTALNTCSSNPLSNTLCSGYTAASNACSANQLTYTYCPSYTTAIAACATNPQGNTMCPGYSPTASSTMLAMSTSTEPSSISLVADPIVNESITTTATSASPAQSATATVPLVPAPAATTTVSAISEAKEDKKEETKSADSSSSGSSSNEQKKDQPKTARQEIQERRVAAARAKAVEAGKEQASKMGEAASLEAQVAVQNVVIQAMGFTPGFDAYNNAIIPDAQGYRPFEIYPGQSVVDNPQGRRFMTGSDRLHQDMVDSQYNK